MCPRRQPASHTINVNTLNINNPPTQVPTPTPILTHNNPNSNAPVCNHEAVCFRWQRLTTRALKIQHLKRFWAFLGHYLRDIANRGPRAAGRRP